MRVIIGIASGATQRALVRNLNGKRGPLALENLAPYANNCRSFHDSALSCLWKIRAPCVAKYLQEVGTLPVRIGFRESMSSLGLMLSARKHRNHALTSGNRGCAELRVPGEMDRSRVPLGESNQWEDSVRKPT